MVFNGPLFDIHPRYMHFKNLMLDFFRGMQVESMEIEGLQHVISVSVGEQLNDPTTTKEDLPSILFRVYIIRSKRVAESNTVRIELEEMGPRMDLKLGRWQEANEDMMKMALQKPKDTAVHGLFCGADDRSRRRRMWRLILWEISWVGFMLVCRTWASCRHGK
jgi:ribosome production factor 2